MPESASQERINQLKAEIAKLEQTAIQELIDRRNSITRELATVDAELAKLTGKPLEGKKPRSAPAHAASGRNVPLSQLKEELAGAPDRTLNIRKANLELRNIKNLVRVNPGLLRLGGKGAWPTVTLLTPTKSKLHPLEPELG
jgi:chromosome segregation ATPase